MTRLHKTMADYLVIAVSPALIMVLIGSVVFFLMDVFKNVLYVSNHEGRLDVILGCFIFAAVLIGRIAIEIGKEHAMMYAFPLAIVTAIAMNRFVGFGGWAAPYAMLINVGLMGLIWYCAHKLTWDCTMVDENQDASGEGLLQRLGLESGKGQDEKEKGGGDVSTAPLFPFATSGAPPATCHPPPTTPDGLTGGEYRPRPWWERLMKPPPRAHSPGASVIWFSLAALVLFGIGQFFIPASDEPRRRHAFTMLLLFVASALGLLLTTSFLGLRRYLRQRRLQMPAAMAGLWIAIGCALIVGVLVFAMLLPRPSPEYAVSQVPWKSGGPEHGSSRAAVGSDAAEKDAQGSPTGQDQRPEAQRKTDPEPKGGSSGEKRSDAENTGNPTEEARGSQGKSSAEPGKAANESGEEKSGKGDAGQSDSGGSGGKSQGGGQSKESGQDRGSSSQQGQDQQGGGEQGKGSRGGDTEKGGKSPQPKQETEKGEGKEPQEGEQGSGKAAEKRKPSSDAGGSGSRGRPAKDGKSKGQGRGGQRSTAARPPSAAPRLPLSGGLDWLMSLLKWVVYGVVIVAAAWWLWRSRHQLPEMLRRMLEAWRGFWSWLFGGRRKQPAAVAAGEPELAGVPTRRFADFVDPFATGTAGRYQPDELVRYSFEALEAWARDNGLARDPDQTPYEFSQRVGARVAPLAGDVRRLAELYYQAAYARGSLSARGVRPLEELWRALRTVELGKAQ